MIRSQPAAVPSPWGRRSGWGGSTHHHSAATVL